MFVRGDYEMEGGRVEGNEQKNFEKKNGISSWTWN
jgi:hypothetical protein